MLEFDPELNEMGERVLRRSVEARHPDAILTRGIIICEFLSPNAEYRGVIASQFGRQGLMQPYEVLGLIAPAQAAAQRAMMEAME